MLDQKKIALVRPSTKHTHLILLLCAISFASLSAAEEYLGLPPPPDEATHSTIHAITQDPDPGERPTVAHYYTGNEDHLHLYRDIVTDLGGAYAGVGADQAYLFIGWQKPEVAWLTDYDTAVQATHLVHQALILAAKSPTEYVDLWNPDNLTSAIQIVERTYPSDPKLSYYTKKILSDVGDHIHGRLRRVRRVFEEQTIPSFLSDQAMFDFVRGLIAQGRVHTVLCNLIEQHCFQSIAKASEDLKIPLRVLYLSNAEQYLEYDANFRANMRAQRFDDRSVVLRTLARSEDYEYSYQSAPLFLRWLETTKIKSHKSIKRTTIERPDGLRFSVADKEPQ